MLMASGTALLLAHNETVSVSYDSGFTGLGQGDFLGFPDRQRGSPLVAYIYGSVVAQLAPPLAAMFWRWAATKKPRA